VQHMLLCNLGAFFQKHLQLQHRQDLEDHKLLTCVLCLSLLCSVASARVCCWQVSLAACCLTGQLEYSCVVRQAVWGDIIYRLVREVQCVMNWMSCWSVTSADYDV
jgi:hypothetical protein